MPVPAFRGAAVALAALCAAGGPAWSGEQLAGPVPAEILEVVDGDTFVVRARIWLGQRIETRLRLAGIDAPERRGRCTREARLAEEARRFAVGRTADSAVTLRDIRYGKYAGRVLGRIELADGADLGEALMAAGLARAYGGGSREGWCEPDR